MHDEITNSEVEGFKTSMLGNSRPEVFLRKSVLKICSKFTGDYLCRSVISIQLLYNFIEIALWHGCSPVICAEYFQNTFY